MKHLVKTAYILSSILLLQACAGPQLRLEQPGQSGSLGSTTTIAIEDRRPADDKEYSLGSIIVMSSRYAITTLGDNNFEPAVLDTLTLRLQRAFSRSKHPPQKVKIILDRLITENNAQAHTKRLASEGIGPGGVWIAEQMTGHKFEMTIDATKPFSMSALKGNAEIVWADQSITRVPLSVVNARNYQSPFAVAEIQETSIAVLNATLDAAVDAVATAKK